MAEMDKIVGRADSWAGIEERLEKIQKSLRTPSAHRSRRVRACDCALRSCVDELARPGGQVAHGVQLLALAQEATQLYLSLVPEPPHLYVEKILFHVLQNAAGWVGPQAWSVAELLRARLRQGRRHGDWATIVRNAFGLLWRAAAALAGPERPREEGRALLTARIRAVRFLLLLEPEDGDSAPRDSFQPPFFTSRAAQNAAAAAALYEAHRAPSPLFLAKQLQEFLLDALRDEAPDPPGFQESLCFLELALQRCRQLCKARRPHDALDALRECRAFVGAQDPLGAPLELLEAGVRLSQALLSRAAGAAGPALSRAGAALAAERSGRVLRLQLEISQFVLEQLGAVLGGSRELPLGPRELPGLCALCQGHGRGLRRLLAQVPPDSTQEQLMVKQLLFHSLQLFSNAIHKIFQHSQPSEQLEQAQVTTSCVRSVTWMLEGLEGLPEAERGKFLDVTAAVTLRLGQALQSRNVPEGAGAVCEPLCQAVLAGQGYSWPGVRPERLHSCFRLHVESWRCRGQPERALDAVAQWLLALGTPCQGLGTPCQGLGTHSQHSQPIPGSAVAEPVALWARIKTEAAKQGKEELRMWTLRDALEHQSCSRSLPGDALLQLLLAELQAYKGLRGPTGPERYGVLCDLLGLWDRQGAWRPPGPRHLGGSRDPPGMPDPGRSLPRAAALMELGQLLCSFSAPADCSALDAIEESLRLLESLARNSQSCNSQIRDQLLDEHAQALLWLHICTLEGLMEKSVARERRGRGRAPGPGWDRDPEGERPEAPARIRCSLSSESALSKPLDEALSMWKKLLENAGSPAVRSAEQTACSLQLLAALYLLQDKPLQALQALQLLRSLCRRLGDRCGEAEALSRLCRLLLRLQRPARAQVFLEELELCLGQDEGSEDSRQLLRHSRLLLRSHLCCFQKKVDEGVALLLEAMKEPQAQRATRSWCLAQAQRLQLVATFLELPPRLLRAPLREQLRQHGWSSPQVALLGAQKVLRSVLVMLMGSDVLGSARSHPPTEPSPDCRPVLLHKWQVLGDTLACCQRLVTLLGHCEVLAEARAFCSEGLTLAGHLQAARRCTWFLVLQSQLELQQGELELSQSHLQHAQFLLQPPTEPNPRREPRQGRAKIQLQKGPVERRKPLEPVADPVPGGEEDEEFLRGPCLELVAPAALPEQPDALTASPELKGTTAWKSLEFLCHPRGCPCSFCRDPSLVALGLCWHLVQARVWLLAGEAAPGLALVRRVLPRCASAGARLAGELQGLGLGDSSGDRGAPGREQGLSRSGDTLGSREPWDPSGNGDPAGDSTPGPLAELVATGYSTLALQSLASPSQCPPVWDEELEQGLTLLGSQSPPVAGLGVAVATLLLAKAVATLGRVAAALGRSTDDILAQAWTPHLPPTPKPSKPQKTPKAPPKTRRQKAKSPKAKVGKTPKAKPPKSEDVFTLGDSDPEVPPIVLLPGGPCTPHPKSGVPPKVLLRGPRTPFTIFSEEPSLPRGSSRLRRAPKMPGRVKSRIRVTFSDSDSEEPQIPPDPPKSTQKISCKEIPGTGEEGDPPNPEGPCPSAQPGVPSLAAVRSLLAEALAWLAHSPPGSLYAQLCQLLAMALGDRNPLATAGLLAESLGVTMRHQLLAIVHARARKKGKAAAAARGDISDQLRGLSLDPQDPQDPQDSQDSLSHLAELEELFQFSSTGLGPAEQERFREQLQKIPSGVTVCQLSLASATPGALGDTLLLTRLERGQEPVSVRIATGHGQAPLSGLLREFERIQREQREANACTERREWWERRSHLDQRMESLIQSLDSEVLGCWRGLLLPRDPENSPLDELELSELLRELRECGWDRPEPALLRALLAGLCPADVRPLAAALCPARPLRARLLLDEALERRREGPGGSAGSLVLLLDRHLQRLPWESSRTLRNVPVTRLPGLRFLLSYGLARQRSGSVLSRGVNPRNAFYVLNPQRDLGGTEDRFRGWFESEPGWFGVSGTAPTPQQLQEALGQRDLYIYAGHGAGARLLDGQSLARLPCRAVVLLFGCSSAALAPRGPLEPSGTVLKFVLAGCPLVLGNLWDVTDRDLDRLAQALLRGWLGGGPGTPLLAQLAQARQAPRLKSLVGAAPVAYGLPVSLC